MSQNVLFASQRGLVGQGARDSEDAFGFVSMNNGAYMPPTFPGPQPMAPAQTFNAIEADEDYENEPPLLEELGIDFKHIWMKLSLVMHPLRPVEETVLNDTDLAGPLVLACILGFCSLLAGKIHFGYIYGFGGIGCLAMYTILNLMNKTSVIDMSRVFSVLGYSMLPIVVLSAVNILFDLRGWLGLFLAGSAILLATHAASRIVAKACGMQDQFFLVAYPILLLYGCFALITVF